MSVTSRRDVFRTPTSTSTMQRPDPGTSPVGNMTRNELKELVLNSVQTAVEEVRALSVKTGLKKNIRVDRRTANEINNIVADLAKEGKTWNFDAEFRNDKNPDHTSLIIKMLENRLGMVSRDEAYKGCRSYFHTLKRQDKDIKRGKLDASRKKQRKRQRLSNTRIRRLSALNGYAGCTEEEWKDLEKSLTTTDYISSEESDHERDGSDEENDNTGSKFLIKRPLQWRSQFLTNHYAPLDRRSKKQQKQKKHGGTQCYERRAGSASAREEPLDPYDFAVAEFQEP